MNAGRLIFAASLLGSAQVAWAQDDAVGTKPQSDTVIMTVPTPVYATPIEAAADLVGGFPESLEGRQTLSVEAAKYENDPEQLLMIVTLDGLLDDSTSAQRYTIRLKPVADGWQRSAYKLESRCARGGELGDWKVGTCP